MNYVSLINITHMTSTGAEAPVEHDLLSLS